VQYELVPFGTVFRIRVQLYSSNTLTQHFFIIFLFLYYEVVVGVCGVLCRSALIQRWPEQHTHNGHTTKQTNQNQTNPNPTPPHPTPTNMFKEWSEQRELQEEQCPVQQLPKCKKTIIVRDIGPNLLLYLDNNTYKFVAAFVVIAIALVVAVAFDRDRTRRHKLIITKLKDEHAALVSARKDYAEGPDEGSG
jgi:hypothetical protein